MDEQNQNWGTSLDKLIWTTNFAFYSIKIQLDLSLTVTEFELNKEDDQRRRMFKMNLPDTLSAVPQRISKPL